MTQIDERITFKVSEKTSVIPNAVVGYVLTGAVGVLIYFIAHLNNNVEDLILKVQALEIKMEYINKSQNKITSNVSN